MVVEVFKFNPKIQLIVCLLSKQLFSIILMHITYRQIQLRNYLSNA